MDSFSAHSRSSLRFVVLRLLGGQILAYLEVVYFFAGVLSLAALLSQHVGYVKQGSCDHLVRSALRPVLSGERNILEIKVAFEPHRIDEGPREDPVLRFAKTRELIAVPKHLAEVHNLGLHEVTIHAEDRCFGSLLSRSIVMHATGYEVIFLNALQRIALEADLSSYVYSLSSHKVYKLTSGSQDNRWSVLRAKFGALLTSLFVIHTMSGLVTFALRLVQVRILKLSMDLRAYMLSQLSCSVVDVIVRYSIDAIVFVPIVTGVLFFLREFFEDLLLTFMIVLIAWLRELVVLLSVRHWACGKYLPRLLSAYFLGFHLYFFCFPLGYSWLALFTCTLFMQHAVLMVWNRSMFDPRTSQL